jgi:hypothetical protein
MVPGTHASFGPKAAGSIVNPATRNTSNTVDFHQSISGKVSLSRSMIPPTLGKV